MIFKALTQTAGLLLLAAALLISADARALDLDQATSLNGTCDTASVSMALSYALTTVNNKPYRMSANIAFPMILHRLCNSTRTVDFSLPANPTNPDRSQKVILCRETDEELGWHSNEFFNKHAGDQFISEMPEIATGKTASVSIGNVLKGVSDQELDSHRCFLVTMTVHDHIIH